MGVRNANARMIPEITGLPFICAGLNFQRATAIRAESVIDGSSLRTLTRPGWPPAPTKTRSTTVPPTERALPSGGYLASVTSGDTEGSAVAAAGCCDSTSMGVNGRSGVWYASGQNTTQTVSCDVTALPCIVAGAKVQVLTARTASSVTEASGRATRTSDSLPVSSMVR